MQSIASGATVQRAMECGFQGVVPHARWPSLRTVDGTRCVQPFCVNSGAFAQPERRGGASSDEASFSPLRFAQGDRVDNGAPFGGRGALGLSRLSVWWLRLGIAVEFIRRAHPQDNAAHEQMHRIFKADAASPPAGTFRAQKRRTNAWIKCYNYERPHEALGQRVPGGFIGPAISACGAVAQSELSTRMGHKESAQPWTHQMARARAFYRTSLCRRIGGTEKDGGGHPRSLSRFPSHRLALRPRSGRNAPGLHCPSSLMLSACPPLESERAAWRRAPEQTAAPPSSYLASLFRRDAKPTLLQKCHPCH